MKITFFDTETTGVPHSYKLPPEQYTRIGYTAFIQTNKGKVFKSMPSIVKPEGFEIPEAASAIHGITTDHALLHGIELKQVMTEFGKAWRDSDVIVAHNLAFDSKIVDGEAWLLWGKYFITNKPHFCTMQNTTDLLQIPGPYGYKFPKLMELHEYLFDQSFDGAHDALADVTATMNCYFELEKRGLINKILLP